MLKAKLFKLTASEQIPCRKFRLKLEFTRKNLLGLAESQTKPKGNQEGISKSCSKKSQLILYKRHNTLRNYNREAIKRELTTNNSYNEFSFKKGRSKYDIALDEMDLKKIMDYKSTCERLQKIRDMYLFQYMTALAFGDMQGFSKDKVSHVDGSMVIHSSRVKTDEPYIIPLFAEAQEVLEKYDYSLPRISNQKYNDYIKLLVSHAGIEKNLTIHTARHTFRTYLINKGVPIAIIQRAMGHSKLSKCH